jgi:hypothetical protein
MRVGIETRERLTERGERNTGCGGSPTAMGWGHPEREEPSDMDPDERGS